MANMLYLKVLDSEMRSCNGGNQQWQLGKWLRHKGPVAICKSGLHLTLKPKNWVGKRVFIAETPKVHHEQDYKAVARTVRLLRELSPPLLAEYEKARDHLWAEYDKARAPLWAEYEKARDHLWAEYDKARDHLWAEYKQACQNVLRGLLSG